VSAPEGGGPSLWVLSRGASHRSLVFFLPSPGVEPSTDSLTVVGSLFACIWNDTVPAAWTRVTFQVVTRGKRDVSSDVAA
jgi:hypothetical protein